MPDSLVSAAIDSNRAEALASTQRQFSARERGLLAQLVRAQRGWLILAVLSGLLAGAALIGQWWLLALLIQRVLSEQQPVAAQFMLIIAIAVLVLLRALFQTMQDRLAQKASRQAREQLRSRILQAWTQQSAAHSMQQSPALLASQLIEDVESTDGYFSRFWPQQILAVLLPLLIVITVGLHNWVAALILLCSAPLIPLFMVLVGMGAQNLNVKFLTRRQRLAGHFLDRVKHLTMLRLFCADNMAFREIRQRSDDYRNIVMKTLRIAFLSSAVLEFFASVAIASVAIYIGFALLGAISWGPASQLSLSSGLFILLLTPEFFQPLRNLAQFYHDRAAAQAAAVKLAGLLGKIQPTTAQPAASQPTTANTAAKLGSTSEPPALQAEQLVIGYSHSLQQVLNFSLCRGQCLLISGPSGVGKTTLLHTLAGVLPALSGQVRINNKPVSATPVAYLPQRPWLVDGSWADNIRLLAGHASDAQIWQVLHQLELSQLAHSQPQGINAPVSAHGDGLSGGQLQRLALARLMLCQASVMLLDEPTASLDGQSRQVVLAALAKLKTAATLVIVSHDTAVQMLADQHLQLTVPEPG